LKSFANLPVLLSKYLVHFQNSIGLTKLYQGQNG